MLKKQIRLINQYVKITQLLSMLGIEASRGNVCCPFHNDKNPSAHIYENPEGQILYCFTENKTYTPYNLVRLLNLDEHALYHRLVEKYGSEIKMVAKKESVADRFPNMNAEGMTIEKWFRVARYYVYREENDK